jgi:hypothetical protein
MVIPAPPGKTERQCGACASRQHVVDKLARPVWGPRRSVRFGSGNPREIRPRGPVIAVVPALARLERILLNTPTVFARSTYVLIAAVAFCSLGAACAHPNFFPGTTILHTEENQKIVDTVDLYRKRLTERNVEGLLIMASTKYREDSGTPRSDDDYGYEGLRQVLKSRLTRLKSIWYEIEMRDIQVHGALAEVDVFLNGSFEMAASGGDRYRRVNDYHRFVLERDGEQWKFVSGM